MPFKNFTTGQLLGLNEDPNPQRLEDGELTRARNVSRTGNMVGTRPGAVRPGSLEDYENQNDENKPIQGLWEYRQNFDTGRQLLTIAEHTDYDDSGIFYEDDGRLPKGGAWPTMSTGQDNVWTFASFQNQMFAAGGAATDDFITWDGNTANSAVTVDVQDSAPASVRPQYVFAWNNYILMNGMRGGVLADNNPMASRYCDFGADPTVPANWNIGNTLGFTSAAVAGLDSYGKVYSTGFGSYEDNQGQWLLVLTNKSLQAYVLDKDEDFAFSDAIPNGCVNQRAFVNLGLDSGDCIYMSERGFHSLRQSQAHGLKSDFFISEKIRPTFATIRRSRMKYSVGAYDDQLGVAVWAVTTGGNAAHNLLLVLDVKDQERITARNAHWYLWSLSGGLNINAMYFGRSDDDDRRLYFGTTEGDVGYFDGEVFSDFTSAGGAASAYKAEIQTKHNDLGTTLERKTLGDGMITLQPGGTHKPSMTFIFDYGARRSSDRNLTMASVSGDTWAGDGPVGTLVWGTGKWAPSTATRDEKFYGAGQFRTVAFNVSHSTANQPFRVGKIDYQAAGVGEATGNVEAA